MQGRERKERARRGGEQESCEGKGKGRKDPTP